mgnify:CR=1 FL=1
MDIPLDSDYFPILKSFKYKIIGLEFLYDFPTEMLKTLFTFIQYNLPNLKYFKIAEIYSIEYFLNDTGSSFYNMLRN